MDTVRGMDQDIVAEFQSAMVELHRIDRELAVIPADARWRRIWELELDAQKALVRRLASRAIESQEGETSSRDR